MLTREQIQENKIKYLEIASTIGVDLTDFSTYLDGVGYFEAPNTTQYFRAYPGGLCQTAIDMYNALKAQADRYMPGAYTDAAIATVALFKNIYRAEMYEQVGNTYKTRSGNIRPVYGDLGVSSFMTVRHFFKDLDDEVAEAIMHGSISDNSIDIYEIRKSYPLVTLTALAELLVTSFGKE